MIRAAFALSLVAAVPAQAQDFDARAYLDSAIAIVRDKALYADRVDWQAVSARVHAEGDAAADVFGTYPALVTLVRALGDRHSFLQLSGERQEAYRAARGSAFVYPPSDTPARLMDRSFIGRPDPVAEDRLRNGWRVRTVIVPAFMGPPDVAAAYAGALYRQVSAEPRPCGYVIDLRGNTGGNMWPMLAGLSPLIGDGAVGGYTGRTGDETWFAHQGQVGVGAFEGEHAVAAQISDWRAVPGGADAPVALLIDSATASSGEIVAVAFSGRAHTRRFGQATVGVSTATTGFALADGANLVIVTDVTFDRAGTRYEHGLEPDEAIAPGNGENTRMAAERWVASQCADAH